MTTVAQLIEYLQTKQQDAIVQVLTEVERDYGFTTSYKDVDVEYSTQFTFDDDEPNPELRNKTFIYLDSV